MIRPDVTQPPAKAGGFVPGATPPSYRGASETPTGSPVVCYYNREIRCFVPGVKV
jgi:hypothetical protein